MASPLFDQLRALELPPQDHAIFGSGPLAIRDIIPACGDLDIVCRGAVWETVCAQGSVEYLQAYDVTIASFFDGAITFGCQWGIGDFDVDTLIDSAEVIEQLPFVQLEFVIAYKKLRLSEKDKDHLAAFAASDFC